MNFEEKKIIDGLKKQLLQIDELISKGRKNHDFDGWVTKTKRLLERIGGKNSSYVEDFNRIGYSPGVIFSGMSEYEFEEEYKRGLKKAKSVLQNIIEELEEQGFPNNNISKNQNSNINKNQNNITVNIHNNLSATINNILENNLTFSQYKELNEILALKDKKEKESKLSAFLSNLSAGVVLELLKQILLN